MSPSIKYCIVPQCKNTGTKTPDKLFFVMPMHPRMRKKWHNAIRRALPLGPKTPAYCCEDHFDVENDMENYVKYKLVGGMLKLKKGVVPHKFACQNRMVDKPERPVMKKLKTARLLARPIEEIVPIAQDVEELYIMEEPATVEIEIDPDPLNDTNEKTTTENVNTENAKMEKKKSKKIQVNITNKVYHKGVQTEFKYFSLSPKVDIKKGNKKKKRRSVKNNASTKPSSK